MTVRQRTKELLDDAVKMMLEYTVYFPLLRARHIALQSEYIKLRHELYTVLQQDYLDLDQNAIVWLLDYDTTVYVRNALKRLNQVINRIYKGEDIDLQQELESFKEYAKVGIKPKSIFTPTGTDISAGKYLLLQPGDAGTFTFVNRAATRRYLTDEDIFEAYHDSVVFQLLVDDDSKINTALVHVGESKMTELNGMKYIAYVKDEDGNDVENCAVYIERVDPDVPLNIKSMTMRKGYQRLSYYDSQGNPVFRSYTETVSSAVRIISNGYFAGLFSSVGDHHEITNVKLYQYDPDFHWDEETAAEAVCNTTCSMDKFDKGRWASGARQFLHDLNDLQRTQMIDDHDWTRNFTKEIKNFVDIVNGLNAETVIRSCPTELIGDEEHQKGQIKRTYLLCTLLAVRYELLKVFHRQLNEIRKKGLRQL